VNEEKTFLRGNHSDIARTRQMETAFIALMINWIPMKGLIFEAVKQIESWTFAQQRAVVSSNY
jgi:hypothetical protein